LKQQKRLTRQQKKEKFGNAKKFLDAKAESTIKNNRAEAEKKRHKKANKLNVEFNGEA
jgi:hypothetical protein